MSPGERDDLGKRVFDNTVFMGRPVKLTNWCDAAAVIETLGVLGYEIREAPPSNANVAQETVADSDPWFEGDLSLEANEADRV